MPADPRAGEREPSIEEVADGIALWQEHRPRRIEDWQRIARDLSAECDELRAERARLLGRLARPDRALLVAFVRAFEAAPAAPWDGDKHWTEQDFSEEAAGLAAVAAALSGDARERTERA